MSKKVKVNRHQFNRFYNIIYLYSGNREKILEKYHKTKLPKGRIKIPLEVVDAIRVEKLVPLVCNINK